MKAIDDLKEEASGRLQTSRQEAREVGDDVADIAREFGVLARKEMDLARAEASEQVAITTRALIFGALAAVMAVLGLVFLGLALHLVYDTAMEAWLAALLTAATLFAIAAILGLLARARLRSLSLKPERTINSLRRDAQWARSQLNFSER